MSKIITKVFGDIIRVYDTETRGSYELDGTEWSATLTPSSLTFLSFGKQIGVIYTDQALNLGNSIFGYTIPANVPVALYNQSPGTPSSPGNNGGGLNAAQVADLIVAGNGLTETVDPVTGQKTLSNNVVPVPLPTVQYASIFGDLATLPFQDGLVFCAQYWPGAAATGGTGGIFTAVAGTTLAIDNVNVFAGSGCRWVRTEQNGNIDDAGAIYGQAAPTSLSTKFATLAAAQAWYPGARIDALTEDVNFASVQHALTVQPCKVFGGTGKIYRFNKALEYFSSMSIEGDVRDKCRFVTTADNMWVAKLAKGAENPVTYYYQQRMTIKGLRFEGSATAAGGAPFDAAKSGFYCPYNLTESVAGVPFMFSNKIEDCYMGGFAGHAWMFGNAFNQEVNNLAGGYCAGWFIFFGAKNSCRIISCYAPSSAKQGGYWCIGGLEVINCNGIDTYNISPNAVALRVGGISPLDGSTKPAKVEMTGGNLEGSRTLVQIYGGALSSFIMKGKGSLQYYCTDVNQSPIEAMEQSSYISIGKNIGIYNTLSSTATPESLVVSRANAPIVDPTQTQLTFRVISSITVDAANAAAPVYGTNVYGAGFKFTSPKDTVAAGPDYAGYRRRLSGVGLSSIKLMPVAEDAVIDLQVVNVAPTGAATNGSLATFYGTDDTSALYNRVNGQWKKILPEPSTQALNATGTVTSWNSIVTIGATPLTANVVITLPTIVGKIGQSVRVVRLDNAAFTVSFVFAIAGQSFVVAPGTQLDTQGGYILLTPISATKVLVSV